jgi:hypothetical protein
LGYEVKNAICDSARQRFMRCWRHGFPSHEKSALALEYGRS